MKVLLSILCGLIALFAGGCTLLAMSAAGLSGVLASGLLILIPAAVAIVTVMVLAALLTVGAFFLTAALVRRFGIDLY